MGFVHLALRVADGAVLALKTITPEVAGTQADVARFLREANTLRQLDHPNIVAFRDMGESADRLYFAMEFIRGTDAHRLLRAHGPLPVRRAVGLTCQLLEALEYAHAKGFVHRDIKPANVLVTEVAGQEGVKLTDFGLARVYQASTISGLTLKGEVAGTIAFLAPEQITNFREAKPAADQYSAAASLYNLLTSSFVYDLPRLFQDQLLMILQGKPVPIRKRRADIPDGLAGVIHRALAREPKDRFADVSAMREALVPYGR
jgi:serine/threonine-protein kinase